MLSYLSFLTEEIRARRRTLGLSLADRGLILADCASQHSAKQFAALRKLWCQQNNVATGAAPMWVCGTLCLHI